MCLGKGDRGYEGTMPGRSKKGKELSSLTSRPSPDGGCDVARGAMGKMDDVVSRANLDPRLESIGDTWREEGNVDTEGLNPRESLSVENVRGM